MRAITSILAMLILFLSVEPGITAVLAPQQEACSCGGHCTPVSDTPEKKDANKKPEQNSPNCNPFQACGGCTGYIVQVNTFHTVLFHYTSPEQRTFHVYAYSQFIPDFWQPPKIG